MLQIEELRLSLQALRPDIDDLAEAIGYQKIAEQVEELEEKAAMPGFWNDLENSQKIVTKTKQLKDTLAEYDGLVREYDDAATLIEIAQEEEDESLAEEIRAGCERTKAKLEEMKLATLLTGPYDSNNAILTFHAGAGGTEAQDWAQMLYRMYTRWAERHDFTYQILDYEDGDEAGIKSASIAIQGDNAYGLLKSENGVHRLVRVSPFDANARRQTSFAAVEVMPEIEDDDEVEIREEDIEMQVYRASGAGGQHVNKTSSAVRLIHKPTGMIAECQEERSQFQNREKAMRLLASRLYEAEREKRESAYDAERRSQVGSGDRSQRIRTYNFPQGRVTDHRIGLTLYKIDAIMDGALDELIDALVTADRAEKLKQGQEAE